MDRLQEIPVIFSIVLRKKFVARKFHNGSRVGDKNLYRKILYITIFDLAMTNADMNIQAQDSYMDDLKRKRQTSR